MLKVESVTANAIEAALFAGRVQAQTVVQVRKHNPWDLWWFNGVDLGTVYGQMPDEAERLCPGKVNSIATLPYSWTSWLDSSLPADECVARGASKASYEHQLEGLRNGVPLAPIPVIRNVLLWWKGDPTNPVPLILDGNASAAPRLAPPRSYPFTNRNRGTANSSRVTSRAHSIPDGEHGAFAR